MANSKYSLRAIKQDKTSPVKKGKVKNSVSKVSVKTKNLQSKSKKYDSKQKLSDAKLDTQNSQQSRKRKLQNASDTVKKISKLNKSIDDKSRKSEPLPGSTSKLKNKNIPKKKRQTNILNEKPKLKEQNNIKELQSDITLKNSSINVRGKKNAKSKDNENLKEKKIKVSKTQEAKLLIPKTNGEKYVGAHVSISGGIHKAVTNAVSIGAKAFGLFLRSQRQWIGKPLSPEAAKLFQEACKIHNFTPNLIIPHGSYLLNCGSPDQEILNKSRSTLIDELKRCEMLGLTLFNFHPGSTCGLISIEECIRRIAESINIAHKKTKNVTTVIENMSKQGHTIGGDFRELRCIIDLVDDKSRIGVCLDTCHAFAAGYNISNEKGFNEMMTDFETIVGMEYLKAVHLNDSLGKVGCHLDRHENIGRGHIGINGFKHVMNDARFNNLPLILETPANIDDEDEIKILYSLCDM